MNIDTKHMSQDDLVRRWSSDAAINWDDEPVTAGEGGFIAARAVVLFVVIAIGSFIAVVTQ